METTMMFKSYLEASKNGGRPKTIASNTKSLLSNDLDILDDVEYPYDLKNLHFRPWTRESQPPSQRLLSSDLANSSLVAQIASPQSCNGKTIPFGVIMAPTINGGL